MTRSIEHFLLIAIVTLIPMSMASAEVALGETEIRVFLPLPLAERRGSVYDFGFVEITGDIRRSAIPQLAAALKSAHGSAGSLTLAGDPIIRIFVNSKGGEILAAMEMGRLIRSQAAEVWVAGDAECSSACIFLLAGGVNRVANVGAQLGLHRPYFQPNEFASLTYAESQEQYRMLIRAVRMYLSEMAIANDLYDALIGVPSHEAEYLPRSEAESMRLLGEDPAYQEWQRARAERELGDDRIKMLDRYSDCVSHNDGDVNCSQHLRHW